MLMHMGTVILECERIILRRFTMHDAEAMYRNWASDEEVAKYMRWNAHKTIDETKEAIKKRIDNYSSQNIYHWVIALKETNEPIGNIALISTNEFDRCADIAYCLGRQYWGKGFITEALRAVLEFGLMKVQFNRIEVYHAVDNPASGRVMVKAGMQYEGRMRKKYLSHVGYEDSDLYAILRDDLEQYN